MTRIRIARALSLDRETVSRYIRACDAEVAGERRVAIARALEGAIARWRLVQEQAWADHDADDEREMQALEVSLAGGGRLGEMAEGTRARGRTSRRYRSQRSRYLRIILDAEREIARLEGLYEGRDGGAGGVVFTVVKRAGG